MESDGFGDVTIPPDASDFRVLSVGVPNEASVGGFCPINNPLACQIFPD